MILFIGRILTKKDAPMGLYLFIAVVSCQEKFQSMICHQIILIGLRQLEA